MRKELLILGLAWVLPQVAMANDPSPELVSEYSNLIDKAGEKFGRHLARSFLVSENPYDRQRAEAMLAVLADRDDLWGRVTYALKQSDGFFGYASDEMTLAYLPEIGKTISEVEKFLTERQTYRQMVGDNIAALDPVYQAAKAACGDPLETTPDQLETVEDTATFNYYLNCALEVDIETTAAERLMMLADYTEVACGYDVPHPECASAGYRKITTTDNSSAVDEDLALGLKGLYGLYKTQVQKAELPETTHVLYEPAKAVVAKIEVADEKHKKGKTDSAISFLEKYQKKHPELNAADVAAIAYALGRFYSAKEEWATAAEHFDNALTSGAIRGKDYWAAHQSAIDAHIKQGDYESSSRYVVAALHRCAERDDILPESLYQRFEFVRTESAAR